MKAMFHALLLSAAVALAVSCAPRSAPQASPAATTAPVVSTAVLAATARPVSLWTHPSILKAHPLNAAQLGLTCVYLLKPGGYYWGRGQTAETLKAGLDEMLACVPAERLGVVLRCHDDQVDSSRNFWTMNETDWQAQLALTRTLSAQLKAAGIRRLQVDSEVYFAERIESPWGVFPTPRLAWTREHDPTTRGREWATAVLSSYPAGTPLELSLVAPCLPFWYMKGVHDFWKAAWAQLKSGQTRGIYYEEYAGDAPAPTIQRGPVPPKNNAGHMPVEAGAHPIGLQLAFPGVPSYVGITSAPFVKSPFPSVTRQKLAQHYAAGAKGAWVFGAYSLDHYSSAQDWGLHASVVAAGVRAAGSP